jgi:hypothetical protein
MMAFLERRRFAMGKAKDKGGEKHQKRVAQKSIKEKRAAKKAKKAVVAKSAE